ncbi:RIP metalloprotease [uncultured Brevundimonas sp.]|uniref:M50 family metallopeptidase n=1 Tax=uncultured Brevundimonas sp. TaxID=213418 RepID=UPI0030EB4215|tara:strand:- start:8793 stop:10010 length:1218 start_codon:yes stop_codon:yes gene_type:complete
MLNVLGQVLIYVVPFLLVLTIVVTIHELGHFLVARAFKVKVDRFSIGFGRAVLSRTDRHGIEWRLGWLPLGGYVKFSGDLDSSAVPDQAGLDDLRQEIVAEQGAGAEKAYFYFKPIWQRALITAAGPFANFVLAITIFTVLFSALGVSVVPARVAEVFPDSAASRAGFQVDDRVIKVGGREISDFRDVGQFVALSSGSPLDFVVLRNGHEITLTATPVRTVRDDPISGPVRVGYLGLGWNPRPGEVAYIHYPPHKALGQAVMQTGDILGTTLTYLGRIVTGKESGDLLSGPLGIAKAAGGVTKRAAAATTDRGLQLANVSLMLIQFAAIVSIGIGFLNLLPIPVLDGGHLLFYGYEAVARRPVPANVQEVGYRVGLALLVGLMLFATWNDLQKLSLFKFLGGLAS